MLIDVRKAYLHAMAERELYVKLPAEMGMPDMCGRLNRCLYGTRDAAKLWEAMYSAELEKMGFKRGQANPCCFYCPTLDVRCVVHGDDFTFEGEDKDLDVIQKKMEAAFECKVEGRFGGKPEHKKEVRVLNRIMAWTVDGAT